MSNIHTLYDYKYNNKTNYDIGYILNAEKTTTKLPRFCEKILEFLFVFYKFFLIPSLNNIIRVHETVYIYNDNRVISGRAILDTGNEGLTIITESFLKKIYNDDIAAIIYENSETITCIGLGGGNEKMKTIFLCYKIGDFYHRQYVAVTTHKNEISKTYDMIHFVWSE